MAVGAIAVKPWADLGVFQDYMVDENNYPNAVRFGQRIPLWGIIGLAPTEKISNDFWISKVIYWDRDTGAYGELVIPSGDANQQVNQSGNGRNLNISLYYRENDDDIEINGTLDQIRGVINLDGITNRTHLVGFEFTGTIADDATSRPNGTLL